jgi:hypothetical protein
MHLVLMLILLGGGLYVLWFYFKRFVPAVPKQKMLNPQLIAIFFLTIGCFLRVIHTISYLAVGTDVDYTYYLYPSFLGVFMRLTFGLFYPCALVAFMIQVLLWVSVLQRARAHGKGPGEATWFWYVVFGCSLFLFSFEIVLQFLLTFRIGVRYPLMVYQAFMALLILVFSAVAIVFSSRFVFSAASRAAQAKVKRDDFFYIFFSPRFPLLFFLC